MGRHDHSPQWPGADLVKFEAKSMPHSFPRSDKWAVPYPRSRYPRTGGVAVTWRSLRAIRQPSSQKLWTGVPTPTQNIMADRLSIPGKWTLGYSTLAQWDQTVSKARLDIFTRLMLAYRIDYVCVFRLLEAESPGSMRQTFTDFINLGSIPQLSTLRRLQATPKFTGCVGPGKLLASTKVPGASLLALVLGNRRERSNSARYLIVEELQRRTRNHFPDVLRLQPP